LNEGFKAVVVSDGIDLSLKIFDHPDVTYVKLGRRFGVSGDVIYYGQIALTTGFYLSTTEFTGCLGDDDALAAGSGQVIERAISAHPEIDIWVPTLKYNDGQTVCYSGGGLIQGNVSHPVYRTKIFASVPMYHVPDERYELHDYYHLVRCVEAGWTMQWLDEVCINIRPQASGRSGRGESC